MFPAFLCLGGENFPHFPQAPEIDNKPMINKCFIVRETLPATSRISRKPPANTHNHDKAGIQHPNGSPARSDLPTNRQQPGIITP